MLHIVVVKHVIGEGQKELSNNICLICDAHIHREQQRFEQRLIEDNQFCRRCWDEIMNLEYVDIDFSWLNKTMA
jgi:hypothetical protein